MKQLDDGAGYRIQSALGFAGPMFATRRAFLDWLIEVKHLSFGPAEGLIEHGSVCSCSTIEGQRYIGLQIAEAQWGDRSRAHDVPSE